MPPASAPASSGIPRSAMVCAPMTAPAPSRRRSPARRPFAPRRPPDRSAREREGQRSGGWLGRPRRGVGGRSMKWLRFSCRWTRAGGCRAPDRERPRRDVSRVGQWRGQAATGGSRARRSEEAVDGRGGRHDRAHRHAPCAPGAARDVHVEGSAQEGGPIHAGKRRVERAAKESVPVRDGENVRGHLQRRTRHEERRRRHSRSGRDERRPLARLSPRPPSSCSSFSWTTTAFGPLCRGGAAPPRADRQHALRLRRRPEAPTVEDFARHRRPLSSLRRLAPWLDESLAAIVEGRAQARCPCAPRWERALGSVTAVSR